LFKAKHGEKALRRRCATGNTDSEKAARAVPRVLWRSLKLVDQAKLYLDQFPEAYAVTLNVSDDLLVKAQADSRGPLFYFRRAIERHLKSQFGHPVDFFLAAENAPDGRFHMHGVFGLDGFQLDKAKAAFKAACGSWTGKHNDSQFHFRASPDAGWVRYIFKNPNPDRDFTVTRALAARARTTHELTRKAVRPSNTIGSAPVSQASFEVPDTVPAREALPATPNKSGKAIALGDQELEGLSDFISAANMQIVQSDTANRSGREACDEEELLRQLDSLQVSPE